jgi:pyrroloquinoline quinone biosynthesis protein B
MRVRVLGSAAGGGFPQWNCGCDNCVAVRSGDAAFASRTQDSIAVSADGDAWLLVNASPEIRAQIESFAPLHPRARRQSPIAGVLLTNGDLDHTLGIFSLRESHPINLYATRTVRDSIVRGNVIHKTLERFDGQSTWHALALDRPIEIAGMTVEPFALAGKRPVHIEKSADAPPPSPEDSIGVVIRAGGARIAYASSAASVDDAVRARLDGVDALFFDGTFWSSDELSAGGLGTARAEDMAHWPIGGAEGSLARLGVRASKKIFTHINNTNPILRAGSDERRAVERAGWIVAHDGFELEL